jgi:hypothetical protein
VDETPVRFVTFISEPLGERRWSGILNDLETATLALRKIAQ